MERILKKESAQEIDPREEESPACPAWNQTCDSSKYESDALLLNYSSPGTEGLILDNLTPVNRKEVIVDSLSPVNRKVITESQERIRLPVYVTRCFVFKDKLEK